MSSSLLPISNLFQESYVLIVFSVLLTAFTTFLLTMKMSDRNTNKSTSTSDTEEESSRKAIGRGDRFERHGQWLLSIPRNDVIGLQKTTEYKDFLSAFEKLGNAHREYLLKNNRNMMASFAAANDANNSNSTNEGGRKKEKDDLSADYSFLQHFAMDDVLAHVFSYLESAALVRTAMTCHRLRELAQQSAENRTIKFAQSRAIQHTFQMLRAQEQYEGIFLNDEREITTTSTKSAYKQPFVRMPILGLPKRVVVTNAGDDEYNGTYFCTKVGTNGFVFTKPRQPLQMVMTMDEDDGIDGEGAVSSKNEDDFFTPSLSWRGLRCVISRRFSGQALLWYMSKEVASDTTSPTANAKSFTDNFTYWAPLIGSEHTCSTQDAFLYPSQTSILAGSDRDPEQAWQTLTNEGGNPPDVEIL